MFGIAMDKAIGSSLIEAVRQYQLMELWQKYRQTRELQAVLMKSQQKSSICNLLPPAWQGYQKAPCCCYKSHPLRHWKPSGRISSQYSHELRTPLASLKALTETLQDTALDDHPLPDDSYSK